MPAKQKKKKRKKQREEDVRTRIRQTGRQSSRRPLSEEERSEVAGKAAQARWSKRSKPPTS